MRQTFVKKLYFLGLGPKFLIFVLPRLVYNKSTKHNCFFVKVILFSSIGYSNQTRKIQLNRTETTTKYFENHENIQQVYRLKETSNIKAVMA